MNSQDKNQEFDLVIEAGKAKFHYWKDIWRFRELFYILAWRDIAVRYKQTVIGVLWCIIRPVSAMVVFSVVFGKLGKFPSGGVPYPILVFAAMLPWQFFSSSLSESGNSLIDNAQLIGKVYFPRIIIPASAVMVSLIDFLISFCVLLLMMAGYAFVPSWRIVALPLFLLMAFVASFGAGVWLAALNVKYRDFRYIIPFIVQFGLYISPVGFSSSVVPAQWRLPYSLNPMVGVIDGFRWAILGGEQAFYWPGFLLSLVLVTLMLTTGIIYFRNTERTFADVI